MKSIQRNDQIMGKNCKSYNDKHPYNPIVLRPIRAITRCIPNKINAMGKAYPDWIRIAQMRNAGQVAPRTMLAEYYLGYVE